MVLRAVFLSHRLLTCPVPRWKARLVPSRRHPSRCWGDGNVCSTKVELTHTSDYGGLSHTEGVPLREYVVQYRVLKGAKALFFRAKTLSKEAAMP